MDLSRAESNLEGNRLFNSTATAAFNGGGFEKSSISNHNLTRRKLRRHMKQQETKLKEKDENPLGLEGGTIFGVKSPAS